MRSANRIEELSREELLELTGIFAKNWLAHDGCWFQAIEGKLGMDAAISFDIDSWRTFTVIEARRLMDFLELGRNSGLSGLKKALALPPRRLNPFFKRSLSRRFFCGCF